MYMFAHYNLFFGNINSCICCVNSESFTVPHYGAISLVDKAVLKRHVPLSVLECLLGKDPSGADSEGRVSILSIHMGLPCHSPFSLLECQVLTNHFDFFCECFCVIGPFLISYKWFLTDFSSALRVFSPT